MSRSRNYRGTIAIFALATGFLGAETGTYTLSPGEGSRFALEVYKTGLMSGKKHTFVFERFEGEAVFDPHMPADAKVRFTVDARSVVCTDTWINDGSRRKVQAAARDQVMQADKYPHLSFEASGAAARGGDKYDVEGRLTLRDKTRPVLVHVSSKDGMFEGSAAVRLSDFGLRPPRGVTLGMIGTKDEMSVVFRLVKTKAFPAP